MAEYIVMILLGLLLIALGLSNMRGNLSSIHWYNRKNVKKEDQRPYGRLMGTGTVIIGGGLTATGLLQTFLEREYWFYIILCTAAIGLVLMAYGQLKYNRGFF